jgi:predicted transcriptional regulator of viral defense system
MRVTALEAIAGLKRPIFSTAEIHAIRGGSISSLVQSLNMLEKRGVLEHIRRGLWMLAISGTRSKVNPYELAHYVVPGEPVYISFISALHLHGMIEQIPQAITVASTAHTRTLKTSWGTFFVHRIAPSFFRGYDWYQGPASFLIATPEKALVDCLYVSSRRNRMFSHFPEISFPRTFSKQRAREWIQQIKDCRIRSNVQKKLGELLSLHSAPSGQDL